MKAVWLAALAACAPLGAGAEWTPAAAGFDFHFPADHAAHRDYKTEWWYFTGNVRDDASGTKFGYELTFFREGVVPPADLPEGHSRFLQSDFKFAHFAISDVSRGKFHFAQKTTRGAFGEAGSGQVNDPKLVWLDDWDIEPQPDGSWRIRAQDALAMQIDLHVTPLKAPVIEGENGISQKAAGFGNASHYYSFTRLRTEGTLEVGGAAHAIRGESWFDHEWASNALAADQVGWNWFCFQFDDNTELMLYAMRKRDGGIDPVSGGTFIGADGAPQYLSLSDCRLRVTRTWHSPHTKAEYPIGWQIAVPALDVNLTVRAKQDDQELVAPPISYWEGAITATGTRGVRELKGDGYMELTGYAAALGAKQFEH